MRYELLNNADIGVVVDATPVYRDIKDTFEVSFLLPSDGVYVAVMCDADGVEYRATLFDGRLKIPKQLLKRSGEVQLVVHQTENGRVIRTWECRPFKVETFLAERETWRKLSTGLDADKLQLRLTYIERVHATAMEEYAALIRAVSLYKAETENLIDELRQDIASQKEVITSLKAENVRLSEAFNKAIEVINNLSERIVALEKNYDPTIIN